jgi:ATP-dependent Clp protease ATP-binding subunit ClpC
MLRDREKELNAEIRRTKEEWAKQQKEMRPVVGEDEIAFIVSRWTGIPVSRLREEETRRLLRMEDEMHESVETRRLLRMEDEMHESVVGQHEAIEAISRAIRRTRAGLKDPDRPIGSFVFCGPTGVGKTELARSLARFLFADDQALIRVDMSEYMEKFSVSRLIGAPPGYVGYEDSGALTKAVRQRPYSVVLLDEIEKAHPDVFNILLQVLDEGRLTDNYGRVIDFKNTVLIMTSNVGAREIATGSTLGFASGETGAEYDLMAQRVRDEVERTFTPEFLNRLDEVIVFHSLSKEQIGEIVHIMIRDVQKRLAEENLTLNLSDGAVDFLVERGYDTKFGARPLKRTIQRYVEDALSEKILMAEFAPGDEIAVEVAKDSESLVFRAASRTSAQ